MTATELADELENTYPFVGVMEIAATMLRQQQNEIAALKEQCALLQEGYNAQAILLGVKNAEIIKKNPALVAEIEELKAHPVKELTDEEIEQVMLEAGYGEVHKFVNPFDFARAILLKAQEK